MFRSSKFVIYSSIVLLLLVFAGCATYPENLGLSQSEWNGLDQSQQEQIVATAKKLEAETVGINKKKKPIVSASMLNVKVYNGSVVMPPFVSWVSYKPESFAIAKGECKDVMMHASEGENQVALRSCYKENILYIDASHYDPAKKYGSITITSSPLWQQGFAYTHLSSSGHVKLKDVTVEIKQK